MQDSRQDQSVATSNGEGQTTADSASACSPVEPQENNAGADLASACMSVEETVQTEKTPEKNSEETSEKTSETAAAEVDSAETASACVSPQDDNVVKIMNLTKWTKNLNIQGMGRQRSRLRFTKPNLYKWAEIFAEKGFQIFKGFDNMPPCAGLNVQSIEETEPVHVVTAGKTCIVYILIVK